MAKPSTSTVVAAVVLLALAAAPWLSQVLGQDYYVTFLSRVLILALAAIGLNVLLGFGGLVSLGHGLYLGVGVYAVGILADMGVTSGWAHLGTALAVAALLAVPLGLVCLPDHPLARLRKVRWKDLRDQPVITGRPGYGVRQLVDLTAAGVGVQLQVVGEVSFQSTALWMVASGLGAAIMPTAYARQGGTSELVVKELHEPRVPRDVYIVTKRGRHLAPACEAFLQVLRASCEPARR